MSRILRYRMDILIKYVQGFLQERTRSIGDVHQGAGFIAHDCCQATADEFQLWDDENRFPIWLSRVIAGEMNDISNDDPKAFPNR